MTSLTNEIITLIDKYINENPKELSKINKGNATLLTRALRLAKKVPDICPLIKSYIMNSTPDELNQKMENNSTALMFAVYGASLFNTEQFIQILIDKGADINGLCTKDINDNYQNLTILMFAAANSASHSSDEAVRILINAGADTNYQTKDGTTALMLSILYEGTEKTLQILIDAKADLNLKNNNNETVLDIFIKHRKNYSELHTFKLLIQAGAKMNNLNLDIKKKVRTCQKQIKIEKNKLECASLYKANKQLLSELKNCTNVINFDIIKNNIDLIIIEYSKINKKNRTLFKLNKINKYLQIELECHPGSSYLNQIKEHFDSIKY